MKRFLAIAASVAMIVVAIIVRGAIDDDGGGAGGGRDGGRLTIACVTELEAQCRQLRDVDVRVENASVTAKALASGTANIDGWITFDPWPQVVDALATRQLEGSTEIVASSPLVIAMVQERADAFAPTCGGAVGWKCLGDAIGRPWTDVGGRPEWGTVKAGLPSPSSGLGLLVLGNAASGFFGHTGFATNDFDPTFLLWRSKVTATVATFDEFLLKFPAAFSAVGTLQVVARGSGTRPVASLSPEPRGVVAVTVASYRGANASRVADPLAKLLGAAGWDPAVDATSGVPLPGVLLALSGLTG